MATQRLPTLELTQLNADWLDAVRVCDTAIHRVTMSQTMQLVQRAIEGRERLRIGVVNVAKMLSMRRDEGLRQDVISSDLILADGMPIVWISKLLGIPLPERVAGIDLMMEIFRVGGERGYRVYCLGARRAVLDKVISRLASEYPGVDVVGSRDGYFQESESAIVAQEIASAHPDVLLVAMTSPKKENFLGNFGDVIGVPVCHGVGGSFDVYSGLVKRAPEIWQKMGLEWLYRVKQEPRRLWKRYLVTNTQFLLLVIVEVVRAYGKQAVGFLPLMRK